MLTLRKTLTTNSFLIKRYLTNSKIVISDNGSTLVCWHPRPTIPYELTKPIVIEKVPESNSILKSTWGPQLKQLFKSKHPDIARQELMALTHTTKHRWYPRSRDRRAKDTEMDREYL